ncbi:MAG: hypothetical protein BMS9Abin08_0175 [Gammaproteobacteria bacterium]|nr:MAG: hypothetical protein BMS9Abin08_0175 [Gammaproteobacteria bacterium]
MNPVAKNTFGRSVLRWCAVGFAVAMLSACGGGASTETNPATAINNTVGASNYTGPSAQTEDIRGFQLSVWEPLRVSSRCGACHNTEVGQSPLFVRNDDVNLAYAAANPLIDRNVPASSRLATKVGGGHNCWLPSNAACAQRVTSFIEDWMSSASGAGRQIQLTPPVARAPGATRSFPDDNGVIFDASALRTLLTTNCQTCHSEAAAIPQSPFFASADLVTAYDAVKSKIDLADDTNNPTRSRLTVRLRNEFHNCWTSSCSNDAQAMEDAILAFIIDIDAGAPPLVIDPDLVISNAMNLDPDGIVASGGDRYETNVIALYEFKTGAGTIALDTSNVGDDLNLTLSGDYQWVGGWGIQLNGGTAKAQGTTTTSRKLHDLITATGEYSIEAWVVPGNVTQEGPARIVSYSAGVNARNFTLGQTQYNYDFLHRSSSTDANGEPALSTADADEDLQAALQHVVVNYDPVNGRRIYVNGVFTDDVDPSLAGNLSDWDDSFALVLGNEASSDRPWQGILRMVAIHNRVLTPAQIQQNFDIGVGEKFFLLFGIGDVDGVPANSYIMFEVAQYDSYSYLFNKPTFINLDLSVVPGNIPIAGMRIAINGKEAAVGQAYTNLSMTIGSNYVPATGEVLSRLGTIIALQNGQSGDEFFLTFEVLGNEANAFSEASPTTPPPLPTPALASDIGVRTFDEIDATMAAVTGVDELLVKSEFDVLRQQFPAVEAIEGFLSAHQMAIAQLAIAYCSALVEDSALRAGFFNFANAAAGDVFFNAPVVTAFNTAAGDSAEKNQIVTALYDSIAGIPGAGVDLTTAPARADVKAELIGPNGVNPNNLFERLAGTCAGSGDAGCQADRTRTVVKSMCAATLGSAAMLVQ